MGNVPKTSLLCCTSRVADTVLNKISNFHLCFCSFVCLVLYMKEIILSKICVLYCLVLLKNVGLFFWFCFWWGGGWGLGGLNLVCFGNNIIVIHSSHLKSRAYQLWVAYTNRVLTSNTNKSALLLYACFVADNVHVK